MHIGIKKSSESCFFGWCIKKKLKIKKLNASNRKVRGLNGTYDGIKFTLKPLLSITPKFH
jgi:hypothetical protein